MLLRTRGSDEMPRLGRIGRKLEIGVPNVRFPPIADIRKPHGGGTSDLLQFHVREELLNRCRAAWGLANGSLNQPEVFSDEKRGHDGDCNSRK